MLDYISRTFNDVAVYSLTFLIALIIYIVCQIGVGYVLTYRLKKLKESGAKQ